MWYDKQSAKNKFLVLVTPFCVLFCQGNKKTTIRKGHKKKDVNEAVFIFGSFNLIIPKILLHISPMGWQQGNVKKPGIAKKSGAIKGVAPKEQLQ